MKEGSIIDVENSVISGNLASYTQRFAGIRFTGRPCGWRAGGSNCDSGFKTPATGHAAPHIAVKKSIHSHPEHSLFIRAVLGASGLDVEEYRLAPLLRRIPACLRALRVSTVPDAIMALQDDPTRLKTVVNSLLIGTTSFFRDPQLFARLEEQVVPAMIERNSSPRIWSAGCSDGSELYSVAMLVSEIQTRPDAYFLGSDCRPSVLETAKAAIYRNDAILAIRADLRERYVISKDTEHRICPTLSSRVNWEQRSLLGQAAPGPWDIILCRNVAIYLEVQSAHHMWQRLANALAPGGILVTGRAESPRVTGLDRIGPSLFRKSSSSETQT